MTGIGGPGGVGPKGPPGIDPTGSQGPTSDAADGAGATSAARGQEAGAATETATETATGAQRASAATGMHSMDALAGEIAAGRLTPHQAIDYLVDAAGAQLDPADRSEFREMLSDLFANDPHLRGLIANLGGGRP